MRGNLKGRVLDFIYLYSPEETATLLSWRSEQEPVLWEILGFDPQDVREDREPLSSDEWLQKRAVTALSRIGSTNAILHLERMAQAVAARPVPQTKMLKQKREALVACLPGAIFTLKQRHLLEEKVEIRGLEGKG